MVDRLDYRPNAAAWAMQTSQTRNVGVVLHSLGKSDRERTGHSDWSYATGREHEYDTLNGVCSVLEPAGYSVCVVCLGDIERGEQGTGSSVSIR